MVRLSHVYSIIFILLIYGFSYSDTHYVSLNGTNDVVGKYTNWMGAATQIQWAVDVATNGETVWVSNGTYYLTNQITITNGITLKSFSGSYTNTIINGNYPAYTNRCVFITNSGAVLDGFTITNGFIFDQGAGFYANPCKLITNCLMTGNMISNASYCQGGGGFVHNGYVSHCSFVGNRALGSWSKQQGEGFYIYDSIASNCVISENSGGASALMFSDSGNNAAQTAIKCVISGNNSRGVAINCGGYLLSSIVSNNNGYGIGGNSFIMRNCIIVKNNGLGVQIGASGSGPRQIDNCTIVNNASVGISYSWRSLADQNYIANSIIYYNGTGATNNWGYATTNIVYTNCCIIPIPTNVPGNPEGTGNITNAPLFVDTNSGNYRLSANSLCMNTGTNQGWMTGAVDLDGKQRIRYRTVDMGAYEAIYDGSIYTVH